MVEYCPDCGTELKELLFMGVTPDGYVCPGCNTYRAPGNLHALATVI